MAPRSERRRPVGPSGSLMASCPPAARASVPADRRRLAMSSLSIRSSARSSFWNYSVTAELLGARYPTIPLGLITLAAMLPPEWSVRLVNRNTETLQDADLDWADMVMTGGMLFQQADTLCLIGLTQDRHKPVVVGGPDVTSSPHIYSAADFRVLGRRKRSSPRLSLAGRHPLGGLRGSEVPGRRYEVADPALRSAQFQGLSFRRCPILARLPVHL